MQRSRLMAAAVKSMVLSAVLAALGVQQANAATITWLPPVTITDENDLDAPVVLGFPALVQAVSYGGGAGAVLTSTRSVTFVAGDRAGGSPPAGGDNDTVYSAGGGTEVNGGLFDPTGTTVGAAFEAVLDSQAWGFAAPGFEFRLAGLTPGQQYAIQLLTSDDRSAGNQARTVQFQDTTDGSGSNSTSYTQGTSPYTIGTFVADGTGTQYFREVSVPAGGDVTIQGYTLSTVPEPASVLIVVAAGLIATMRRRRGHTV